MSRVAGKLLVGNVFLSICGSVCFGGGRVGVWTINNDGTWSFDPSTTRFDPFVAKDRLSFEVGLPVAMGLVPFPVTLRPRSLVCAPTPSSPPASGVRSQVISEVQHKCRFLSAERLALPAAKILERSTS